MSCQSAHRTLDAEGTNPILAAANWLIQVLTDRIVGSRSLIRPGAPVGMLPWV
jgi:hypothetical protein